MLEACTLLLTRAGHPRRCRGILLAVASGAFAWALRYALWYTERPHLTRIQSGIVQLAPAPLAIVGGLLLLGEQLSQRLVVASILGLDGVALGLVAARQWCEPPTGARAARCTIEGTTGWDAGDERLDSRLLSVSKVCLSKASLT